MSLEEIEANYKDESTPLSRSVFTAIIVFGFALPLLGVLGLGRQGSNTPNPNEYRVQDRNLIMDKYNDYSKPDGFWKPKDKPEWDEMERLHGDGPIEKNPDHRDQASITPNREAREDFTESSQRPQTIEKPTRAQRPRIYQTNEY